MLKSLVFFFISPITAPVVFSATFLLFVLMRMTNGTTPFKGKVYYYSNINGQEQRVEKEFDNAHDMDQFVQTQKIPLW